MTLGLDGKVSLVTGGGRNIGRQICLTLAGHGSDVVVNVRSNIAEARAVSAEIEALGRRAMPIAADVSDSAAVAKMVDAAKERFGHIDVLVNCAAVLHHLPFLEVTDAMWREMAGTVLNGPINTCRAVIPLMVAQGSGSIVNISGTVVVFGTWPHLGAAKAGLHGLTRGLAREFGPRGVRVNIVVPSTVDTIRKTPRDPARVAAEIARTPLGRFARTTEIADVVAFLAGDMSSYVTGQSIHVNGGQAMP
jgi:NAD(P)-dependent dehydrogenase (short-subunit alcohol dehydrogenase family)